MNLTKAKGNIVELQCIMKFMSMGFECSIPYGDNSKYDILVDIGKEILRVQVKKARWHDNHKTIAIATCAQTINTQKTVRHIYTSDQIDYFATYWEGNVYLIPVDECSTNKNLRIAPKDASTPPNVCMAEDYLVEKILGGFSKFTESEFNEEMPIKERNIETFSNKCIKCGTLISNKAKLCVPCYLEEKHNSSCCPNREILKQEISTMSFTQIGKKYGVTDNAVRKWCDKYGLPRRSSDIKLIK